MESSTSGKKLYHGSPVQIKGSLKPVLRHNTSDHVHTRPAVFATERKDIAALFMFPGDTIASIGFENNIAYICIWGTPDEFAPKDKGGFLYVLRGDAIQKIGKDYEWLSYEEVVPLDTIRFPSVIHGMIECGAQVYFIDDEGLFDRIVAEKENRMPILIDLIPENEKVAIKK